MPGRRDYKVIKKSLYKGKTIFHVKLNGRGKTLYQLQSSISKTTYKRLSAAKKAIDRAVKHLRLRR